MAEPLKKSELNPQVETPRPFPNQQLREGDQSLDSVPERTDVGVETLGSNVVQWRPAQAEDSTDEFASVIAADSESSVAEEYLEFRDAISDMFDQGRRSARETVNRARQRFGYWADEYPLQLFGAIAAVGVVAGVLLRVWRSNRYD
jgi:ElaB/YqjD/DUF883 family membrane-anchored ribosome-binding protein